MTKLMPKKRGKTWQIEEVRNTPTLENHLLIVIKRWFSRFRVFRTSLIFHVFPLFFGIEFCIDFYLLLDLIFHHFRSSKRREIRYFWPPFFTCFLDGIFNGFLPEMEPKRLPKAIAAESLLAPKIHTFPQGVLFRSLGSFWLPFGSILVAFGTLWAPFWTILAPFLVKSPALGHPFREASAKNRRHLRRGRSSLDACLSHQARSGNLP